MGLRGRVPLTGGGRRPRSIRKRASVEDVFFLFGGAKHREESDRHLVERAPNFIEDEKLV